MIISTIGSIDGCTRNGRMRKSIMSTINTLPRLDTRRYMLTGPRFWFLAFLPWLDLFSFLHISSLTGYGSVSGNSKPLKHTPGTFFFFFFPIIYLYISCELILILYMWMSDLDLNFLGVFLDLFRFMEELLITIIIIWLDAVEVISHLCSLIVILFTELIRLVKWILELNFFKW